MNHLPDNYRVGRPSELDEHLFRKIKELVLDGMNLREISEALDISYATMRDWQYENYKGFADNLLSYKHERMLLKADTNLETLQEAEDDRVRLDANKFVAETIGKRHYSKQINTDITSGGKQIFIPSDIAQKNDIETDTSSIDHS